MRESLRRRMFLLVAAGILPLAVMSGIGVLALVRNQQVQLERTTLDVTRALATTVEAELQRTLSVLTALASDGANGGPVPLRDRAERVRALQPYWRSIEVAAGNAVPAVGVLTRNADGTFQIPVSAPVGATGLVLTAQVAPEAFQRLLAAQKVPADSVVSVFDSAGRRVARSRLHESSVGTPAGPSLQALMQSAGVEGVGPTLTHDGEASYTAYTRLRDSNWTVALGIPQSVARESLYGSVAAYGGGVVLSLLFGVIAALAMARGISGPMDELRQDALALGRGETFPPPKTGLNEIREVANALQLAAAQRAHAEAERDVLLAAERMARTQVEAARQRLEMLAAAGAELSRSLEPSMTLATVASTVVPRVADWCRVDLVDAEGNLQRALTHHSDPDKARQGAEMVARLKAAPGAVGSMAWAVETGRSHLVRFDASASLDHERDRDLLTFSDAIGMRAYYIVPLIARGRTLGALAALQAESGRSFSDDDCALIGELAQRAALALDNARLYSEVEKALDRAETANRAKDEFLAMLGHELRNPLAPIVTALRLMEMRGDATTAGERRIIERQVAHMLRLVDDLLDVSRITQGKIQLNREVLDLNTVMARTLELTEPVFAARPRALEVSLPHHAVPVHGDAVRLVQVFCNLLTNAAKFTPPEGRIALTLTADTGTATVSVEDAGSGIDGELLPQVFDLFVQGKQTLDRSAGGLGLGLAIARMLVHMHQGTIGVTSEGPGRGSRFVVELPLSAAAVPHEQAPIRATAATAGGGRVLVVDDNVDAADTIAQLLTLSGYDVRTAGSGDEALAMLDRFVPDLAILDIGLPGMSGHELARRLKEAGRNPAMRLVALTGYGGEQERARAAAAAFELLLTKPVSADELLDVVARLLAPAGYGVPGGTNHLPT